MSGLVQLNEDNSWIVSTGTYDHVLDRLEKVLSDSGNQALLTRVREARGPRLRFLSLKDLGPELFREISRAVHRVHEDVSLAGADGYGGSPEVFDAFSSHVGELARLMDADSRCGRE